MRRWSARLVLRLFWVSFDLLLVNTPDLPAYSILYFIPCLKTRIKFTHENALRKVFSPEIVRGQPVYGFSADKPTLMATDPNTEARMTRIAKMRNSQEVRTFLIRAVGTAAAALAPASSAARAAASAAAMAWRATSSARAAAFSVALLASSARRAASAAVFSAAFRAASAAAMAAAAASSALLAAAAAASSALRAAS